ncbi:MAG: YwiC-like family protein [Armatimonadetes bacterium]|nr:YwiC-like family protein [Armatimonadota bacterium]
MKLPLPKEHGAWGMLFLPLLAGLAAPERWHPAALVVVVMVFFAYAARAPLETLARNRAHRPSRVWLAGYAGLALACALGLVLGWHRAQWLWLLTAILPALLVSLAFASSRRSRAVANELLGALLLPVSAAVGYAVMADRVDRGALDLWLPFALYNGATLPYVRTWIMCRRAGKSEEFQAAADRARRGAVLALLAADLAAVALVAAGWWPWAVLAAFGLATVRTVAGLRLAGRVEVPVNRLGWTEMACSAAFTVLVVAAFAGRVG